MHVPVFVHVCTHMRDVYVMCTQCQHVHVYEHARKCIVCVYKCVMCVHLCVTVEETMQMSWYQSGGQRITLCVGPCLLPHRGQNLFVVDSCVCQLGL